MELHWLPVEQRINFKILLITYKALNGQAPTYLSDFFLTTAQQDRYVRLHKICFAILVITLKITEVGPLQWLPRVYGIRYLWSLKVRTQLTLSNDNLNHTFFFVLM